MVSSTPHTSEYTALADTRVVIVRSLSGNQILLLRVYTVIEKPLAGLVRYVLVLRVPYLTTNHCELLLHDAWVLETSDGVALVSRRL